MTPELQTALDAADVACDGLTDRHIVSIAAADALEILEAAPGSASDALRKATGGRTGSRRVFLFAGELRQAAGVLENAA